ncbi:MAG: hypothetical protein PHV06_07795, partial [bacterium]|nr:hypothetical protein [bacterium]
ITLKDPIPSDPFLKEYQYFFSSMKNDFSEILITVKNGNIGSKKINPDNFDRIHRIYFREDFKNHRFTAIKEDAFTPEDILMVQNWIRYIGIFYNVKYFRLFPLHSASFKINGKNVIISGSVCTGKTVNSIKTLLNGFTLFTDEDNLLDFSGRKLKFIPIPRLLQLRSDTVSSKAVNKFKKSLLYTERVDVFNEKINFLPIPGASKSMLKPKTADHFFFLNLNDTYPGIKITPLEKPEIIFNIFSNLINHYYLKKVKPFYRHSFNALYHIKRLPHSHEITFGAKAGEKIFDIIQEEI